MYICDFSRSVGVGRAMCLNTRGLVRSVIRRIVPPLPAESSPSNTMQTLAPVALTHSCMATSSPCSRRISFSYSFLFILGLAAETASPSATSGGAEAFFESVALPAFFAFVDFLLIGPDSLSGDHRIRAHVCTSSTFAEGCWSIRASPLR